eukprot:TRINITY_DN2221_c0_g1_i1.p2 TRINITY_DN2221_c0_g1~~TRINITY_DN2221_c0_g1_i1.p2  ORF type:complete len:123 (-),score=37.34 TRINITY_DN2221_c0_g1_i1:387-755(-)
MSTITETTGESEFSDKSVFSNNQSEIHDMPFSALVKPTAQELEEDKVESLMESLENGKDVTPIDVMWVQGSEGGNYYFAMGGCHRYEAHKRLKKETVRVKLIKSKPKDLDLYLGKGFGDNLK